MNELIVIMPTFLGGGSERVLSIIMNGLVNDGVKVTLALVKPDAKVEYSIDERVKIVVNTKVSSNKLNKVLNELKFIRSLSKESGSVTFLSFITMYNMYSILATVGTKTKVVVSERCDPSKSLLKHGRWINKVREFLYKHASCVVFQTEMAADYFKGIKPERVVIIPNPIENNLPIKSDYNDEKKFIAAARLEKQKNYPLLMDVMDAVAEKFPDVKLFVYGKGGEENHLLDYQKRLKHPDVICFMGFSNDIHSMMKESYAFLSSSDYEGISNSMLEALAIGVPCICTDCPVGGSRMFIMNGVNGILVPTGDKEVFVNAITQMIQSPGCRERYGNDSKNIRIRLNPSAILDKWKKVLF